MLTDVLLLDEPDELLELLELLELELLKPPELLELALGLEADLLPFSSSKVMLSPLSFSRRS